MHTTDKSLVRRLPSYDKGLTVVLLFAVAAIITSCANNPEAPSGEEPLVEVPSGFPAQTFSADNIPNAERVALGKLLFFSKELSRTRTVSCATCHEPSKAFTDGKSVSIGVEGRSGTRNAPSLANVGYSPYFLREGGVPTLEMQVLVPVQEHNEFDMNMLDVVDRLLKDSLIVAMSRAAYGRDIDAFTITRSIASFERTIVSGRSRADLNQLTESEKRGRSLFMSDRTSCSSCHGGFAFTTHVFANNGAYATYNDPGRKRLTFESKDSNVFKVPSLRNVGVTAPYMHNGGIATIEEVVDVYNRGGFPHPNKDGRIKPLGLTQGERADLVAFLQSLTDDSFLTNKRFQQ